jgi:hypothetical protein
LRFLGGPVNKPIQAVDALFVRRQRWRAVASTSDHEEEEDLSGADIRTQQRIEDLGRKVGCGYESLGSFRRMAMIKLAHLTAPSAAFFLSLTPASHPPLSVPLLAAGRETGVHEELEVACVRLGIGRAFPVEGSPNLQVIILGDGL